MFNTLFTCDKELLSIKTSSTKEPNFLLCGLAPIVTILFKLSTQHITTY